MFFRSSTRFSHRNLARRLGTFRPEVMLLEDRRAPGQTGLGSAVSMSLLGPALTTWQLDDLAATAAVVRNRPAVTESSATAIVPESAELSTSELVITPSKEIAGAPATTVVGNDGKSSMSTAVDLGAQAAQESDDVVSIFDRRVAGPTLPPQGMRRFGDDMVRPADDGGGRNTVVGPNTLTHNLNQCNASQGKLQSETAITHSENVVVAAFNDSRGFFCAPDTITGWGFSLDRGRTWTQGGDLQDVGGGVHHHGDPWMATAPDGTIYMVDLRITSGFGFAGVYFQKGIPGENSFTWTTPVVFGTSDGVDKEAMAVDPNNGNIYMTFTRFSGGSGLWAYRSTDDGATFLGPTLMTSNSSTQGSVPAIGPNGEVYVAYQRNNGTFHDPSGIGFARSLNNGVSYSDFGNIATNTGTFISGTDRTPQFPHIAVDNSGGPNDGDIYITYHSSHLGGGSGHDALFIKSTNGGSTWSSPTRINDDGTGAAQWFPTINVDSSGYLHSFFYDRRGQTGNNTNLYYARSTNGGASWEPNVKVSAVTFNYSTAGNDGVSPYYGDYINADTQGKSGMVAYADGHLGTPDATFTRVGNRD